MANNKRIFWDPLQLKGQTSNSLSAKGEIDVDNTSGLMRIHDGSASKFFLTEDNSQTVSNKNLQNSCVAAFKDTSFTLQDDSDTTKQLNLQLSNITTGTTRTMTVPNADFTAVGLDTTQTITGKTIDGDDNTVQDLALTSLKTNLTDASNFLVRDASGIVVSNTKAVPSGVVVGTTDSQTLTGKVLTGNTLADSISGSGTTVYNTTGTVTLPNATDTLVGKDTTDTLTNKTLTAPTIDVISLVESASPSNPPSGTRKLFYKTDGKLYSRNNNGDEVVVGSGNASGINYIDNPDAETDTTGYIVYADAAGTSPVDGTGGAATVTLTRSTSSPLRDIASFLLTKDASDRQGEGASCDFSIDSADQASVLNISFDYILSSGTFVAGTDTTDSDVTVWIYDVTNAVVIQPAPYRLMSNSTTIPSHFTSVFQTASNSTSYRLIFHVASTSASAYVLKLDNVIVGPQVRMLGSPITDWVAYTPSFTGFGTPTSIVFYYKRVGDSIKVTGSWISGTNTAVPNLISIPSGLSIDNDKTAGSKQTLAGHGFIGVNFTGTAIPSTARGPFAVSYDSASPTQVYISHNVDRDDTLFTNSNGNVFTSSALNTINFEVPIAGWSSSVEMSNNTDTRVVALQATGDPASATSGNPIIFPTITYDTHGAYSVSTGRYTVPVSGYYHVHGSMSSANAAVGFDLYKNAVAGLRIGFSDSNGEVTFSGTTKVNTGDLIDLRPTATFDGSLTNYCIERLSGPASIAATETVAVRYTSNTAQSMANTSATIVNFGNKTFDTHGAVTTGASWKFTAPVSGIYRVSASIGSNSGGGWVVGELWVVRLYKNNSFQVELCSIISQTTHSTYISVNGTDIINLIAGDTIDLRIYQNSGAALNTAASNESVWISIIKV